MWNLCELNPNYVPSPDLEYYWPFCYNLTDIVGQVTLYGGVNVSFTNDRFNNILNAMSFSSGHLQAPPGVYFDGGDYSITFWIYPRAFGLYSSILDFGNGNQTDNIACGFYDTTGQLNHLFSRANSWALTSTSAHSIQLNQWQHLSFVFSSSTLASQIYVNGILFATGTATGPPNNIQRAHNYIGKSSSTNNQDVNAILDEIKIFSVALTQSQIRLEMSNEFYAVTSSSS